MKSIRCAHIIVVADSDRDLLLVAQLRRMEVARITSVARVQEATHLCQVGGVDACIVAVDDSIPDAAPIAEGDAPGRRCGVPSLMLVPTVTPYLRAYARRRGYLAVIPAALPQRLFYRRVGSALQKRRAAGRRMRMKAGIVGRPALAGVEFGQAYFALTALFSLHLRC